ncbi:hypothetical protein BC936DRAFT_137274 [Jimgerdemannia flammicorona]|uniref:Uncharacterized protein n=1 Tax=Jimgerdemannia flammicorona TaxID=994334 RepID=A0A433DJ43_9FUNG|nr:hypothetical protein BC936DRAFT_137274 [Jimgerdemannia flammicorona]
MCDDHGRRKARELLHQVLVAGEQTGAETTQFLAMNSRMLDTNGSADSGVQTTPSVANGTFSFLTPALANQGTRTPSRMPVDWILRAKYVPNR